MTASIPESRSPTASEGRVLVYTSAALNYLPKVRILFRSLRRHHPDWRLHLLLAESTATGLHIATEPIDVVVPIADLSIADWAPWAFCHTLTELATAIKPFMLQSLLSTAEEGDKIIYLDPDIAVFSTLQDIIDALDDAAIVLTPHQTSAETTLAAVVDNEICSLKHGIYNLGFIGVRCSAVGRDFARWWSDRCYYFCRDDIRQGLFTDQRWIDLVPALFDDVRVLRNSRFNLATWNITTRVLLQDADGNFSVDGAPLGFYHFTGFDSGAHRIMALKNGFGNAPLEAIISWYEQQLRASERKPMPEWTLARYNNHELIKPEHRELYRFRVDLQQAFPNPYDADGYLRWWKAHGEASRHAYQRKRQENNFYLTAGYLSPARSECKTASLITPFQPQRQRWGSIATVLRQSWRLLRNNGWRHVITRLKR